jgi:phosphatidylglycerophosphate synthase
MSAAEQHPEPREVARHRWSQAHGSIDPHGSRWVSGWLGLVHRCTVPLARRHVAPAHVTAAGLLVSAAVPALAAAGDGWPLLAAVLAVLAGLLDGVDGALARMDGTATAWGGVLDTLADRCSDLAFLLALWFLGAPAWACAVAAALTFLLEAARSAAVGAGLEGVGPVTLWERPTRVIVTTLAAGVVGVAWLVELGWSVPSRLPGDVVGALAALGVVLAADSVVHFLRRARRSLRQVPPAR